MTQKNNIVNWTYASNYQGPKNLVDPRIAVARQLNWTRPSSYTTDYTIPEPENYNRAVYSLTPIEFDWVKYQVIYKDQHRHAWITACWLTPEEIKKFDRWAEVNDLTYWRHMRPGQARRLRPLLERGASKAEISLDERLLTQGYYKNFSIKYFDGDTQLVDSRLGTPRECLPNLLNDE